MRVLKDKIKTLLGREEIKKRIDSSEFYFEKGRQILKVFEQLSVTDEVKTYLINNKKNYTFLKDKFENSPDYKEIGRLIFTIISYCDSNAYKKATYNEYKDKRVLALAFVRMNNWAEQLISYKFEYNNDITKLPIGSIRNAIAYLKKPSENFTMLSENHRRQVTERLFNKEYTSKNFAKYFSDFFEELKITPKNADNLTAILSEICYLMKEEWKESIIGLISPDSTGWQENAIKGTINDEYIVLWNHKKPNGKGKTIELLKQEIYENEFFRIFYTSDKKPKFIAEIIDIATSQQELDDSKWLEKYPNIEWYSPEFVSYNDDTKNASWIYLARKIYAVNPDDYSDFKYFNGYGYPSVGCQAPIISFKTKKEKEKEIKMENTLKLLKYKKQIILQGPPGTGKTREAKELAKALLNITNNKDLKDNKQFQIIQFHPSYSYEDFVRGIVAKPNSNGDGITYEAENKILVKIAERAWKNYKASSFSIDESDSISKDIWIDDKFNDFKSEIEKDVEEKEIPLSGNITIFKVDYDSFRYGKDWQTPSRINFTDFKNIIKAVLNGTYSISSQQIPKEISLHAHYRYTYYNALLKNFFDKYKYKKPVTKQDLKNFVLIIDEINRANLSSVLGELIYALEYRGEAVDSMYAVDRSNKITLPPNLYIIGTMNTADRSVGHIDYAVRRRFAFVDVLPRDLSKNSDIKFEKEKFTEVSELFIKNFDLSKDYSKEKIEKSDYLSNEFDVKDVWLGHSYFITKDIDIQMRLDYEIKPILREYVKDGVLKELAIDKINEL